MPERERDDSSERKRREKGEKEEEQEEKEEKEEKGRDEKWQRDPVASVTWAAVLIWVGLVLLADNQGLMAQYEWWNAWAVGFVGAGVIVLLQVLVRLSIPEYRWGVTGGLIFGFILLGIGLGMIVGWSMVWPLLLVAIGIAIIVRVFTRRKR